MGCSDLAFSRVYFPSGLEGSEKLLVFFSHVYGAWSNGVCVLDRCFPFLVCFHY